MKKIIIAITLIVFFLISIPVGYMIYLYILFNRYNGNYNEFKVRYEKIAGVSNSTVSPEEFKNNLENEEFQCTIDSDTNTLRWRESRFLAKESYIETQHIEEDTSYILCDKPFKHPPCTYYLEVYGFIEDEKIKSIELSNESRVCSR